MKKEKLKKDIIFIVCVFAAALIIRVIFCFVNEAREGSVVVFQNGQEIGSYMLDEDNIYIIPYGEEYNLLMISNGEAYVSDADCPDGLCIRQRAISKGGESIICLPHKLVIQVVSKEESELDTVTY